jgi:hypothetical protein
MQTLDSCQFSWIIAQGQIKGIHTFFNTFPKGLPINNTTLKLATYLEEGVGNKKYHHWDSGNENTRFMLVFLDHCARTNERYRSIFYNISQAFAHK